MCNTHRSIRSLLVTVLAALFVLTPAGLFNQAAHAQTSDTDWPYFGNDPGGMRYQNVDQINPSNVSQLQPAWVFHTTVMSKLTSFESQPIEVGGTLYISDPHDHVYALDAATGALKWTYNPTDMPPLGQLAICCGQTNRGVAVGDGKVFIARLDAKLVALDANTGQVAWDATVADYHQKYTETMAPQYVDGKVLVGSAGGEMMARGFIAAYDATTGKQLWRFDTVPGPGQPGNDTWTGNSWQSGGATVWTTPEVDPALNLVYIHTGNAGPDLNGTQRAGTNLYANSIVALDLGTGQVKWFYQEVHHDLWDYDLAQPAQLFDVTVNGQTIPVIANAEKDGFYFMLDRRTGTPIDAVDPVHEAAVPTQPAWQHPSPTQPESAISLIPQSVAPGTAMPPGTTAASLFTPPQQQPMVFQPGFESGPEWGAGAYSPRTHYSYIPAGGYEPWIEHAQPSIVNTLGSTGGGDKAPGMQTYGLFDAVDTTTGKIAWQTKVPNKTVTGTAVAGDLVFWGEDDGTFLAQDAKTGQTLWQWNNPTNIPNVGGANGSPAVYELGGREYVVMDFGGNFRERQDAPNPTSQPGDTLVAFALPASGYSGPNVVTANPVQIPLAPLPIQPLTTATSPPAGAQLVEIQAHDFNYYPNHFEVKPGTEVVVHLVNTDPAAGAGFAVQLPDEILQLQQPVMPMSSAYLVFTAPTQPGDYRIFSPGPPEFFGMTGTMRVTGAPAPPAAVAASPTLTSVGRGVSASFTVTFTSPLPGQGEVIFGPSCSGLIMTGTQDQGAGTTQHTVVVTGDDLAQGDNTGIQPGATYYFEVVTVTSSGTQVDNNGGSCYSIAIPTP